MASNEKEKRNILRDGLAGLGMIAEVASQNPQSLQPEITNVSTEQPTTEISQSIDKGNVAYCPVEYPVSIISAPNSDKTTENDNPIELPEGKNPRDVAHDFADGLAESLEEKQKQETNVKEMSDEEMDDILERLLRERQERKKKRERDFEM